ncbi:MAG: arsenite methyltransferase [Gemmatimonadota bacterium]
MPTNTPTLRETVQQKYGEAALRVLEGARSSCCGGTAADGDCCDPITSNLYSDDQAATIPEDALLASLGCGNPTALAALEPGQTVLDLGSGGGIDVLLSANRVGPTGHAFGLDMTDAMLELARANQTKAGVTNATFLKGDIEKIPLPNESVDVIISNCVINLSADKRTVLQEAFRVLRPGGRFAVSDVVVRGELPAEVRESMMLWVGCVAGALGEDEFTSLLTEVGFTDVSIEPTRVYELADAKAFLEAAGVDATTIAGEIGGKVMGAFVRATKPKGSCCGPDCCGG